MAFGLGSRPRPSGAPAFSQGRRATLALSLWSCIVAVVAVFLMTGCGGGGGGTDTTGTNGTNGTTGSQNVTIQGRVIDNNTSTAVAGAVITYGSVTTTSDGAGNFALQAPASGATALTVTGPSLPNGQPAYSDVGYVGTTLYNLRSGGFPIPATTAGQTVNVGNVRLFGVDFPPPPPPI